ncbi:hypothetical protein POUND7_005142, partial [Theobroma cacao]
LCLFINSCRKRRIKGVGFGAVISIHHCFECFPPALQLTAFNRFHKHCFFFSYIIQSCSYQVGLFTACS